MAEAEAPKPDDKPAPKAPGGKLVPILLTVNTLLLTGVLAVLVLKLGIAKQGAGEKDGKAAAEQAPAEAQTKGGADPKANLPGPTLRLADFVVHLRDSDSERYARVSFEMEVADEKAKASVGVRMPQIRDAFLAYLSDRTAEELRGSDAIGRVKGELTQKLTEIAPGAPVRNLYVTELIVQ